jgi:hypothetical protein
MMMIPGPGPLDVIVRERQGRLRSQTKVGTSGAPRLRARLGSVLITLGAALQGGERVERHPCPPAPSRAG